MKLNPALPRHYRRNCCHYRLISDSDLCISVMLSFRAAHCSFLVIPCCQSTRWSEEPRPLCSTLSTSSQCLNQFARFMAYSNVGFCSEHICELYDRLAWSHGGDTFHANIIPPGEHYSRGDRFRRRRTAISSPRRPTIVQYDNSSWTLSLSKTWLESILHYGLKNT